MPLQKDIGIVLRRLDYSETSQILVVFTREHGQQRVIAKGVKRSTKKKASTGIDLLEQGRIVFSQRPGKEDAMATLTEWRQEESYVHVHRDLYRMYAAQYGAEVTAQLTEVNDPHAMLFDAIVSLLRDLASIDPVAALVQFLWTMLREIGLRPEMSRCVNCGRDAAGDRMLHFSSHAGGVICRDCEPHVVEKIRIDGEAALILATLNGAAPDGGEGDDEEREDDGGTQVHAFDAAGERADRRVIHRAFEILDYHLTETMGKQARLRGPLVAMMRQAERGM